MNPTQELINELLSEIKRLDKEIRRLKLELAMLKEKERIDAIGKPISNETFIPIVDG